MILPMSTSSRRFIRLFAATTALVLVVVVVLVAIVGWRENSEPAAPVAAPTASESVPRIDDQRALGKYAENVQGSQLSYINLRTGKRMGTATERYARPALSLAKLYIADYVLDHGNMEEQYAALEMIASSNDETAQVLYDAYPEAIDETAIKYNLLSTRSGEDWGYSVTSTYDVVEFLTALIKEDPTHPILVAMARATPYAHDGYAQDYGTAIIPGALGTKWGWSNDLALNSSATFGEDFVVAAAVTGSADDLSALVRTQLRLDG